MCEKIIPHDSSVRGWEDLAVSTVWSMIERLHYKRNYIYIVPIYLKEIAEDYQNLILSLVQYFPNDQNSL